MSHSLLIQIGALLLSATPLSLIIQYLLRRIFASNNPKLGKTTCICTDTKEILIKPDLIVKTLIFDKHKISTKKESTLLNIKNTETADTITVEKSFLQKTPFAQLMAITTHLCHFSKINKIENIITIFFKKCGLGQDRTQNNYELIERIPDNNFKKLSTSIARRADTNEIFAFSKGNPKDILDRCTRMLINDTKIEITSSLKRKLRNQVKKLNEKGQKVIAFAYKGLPRKRLKQYEENFVENEMILIGMLGIRNPLNSDIIPDIHHAKRKGLKIYLLTEIKERNAVAIAKELEIINENYFESMNGDYLATLNDQKLIKMLSNKEKDFVFAGLKAGQPEKIMDTLKSLGETVAITNKDDPRTFKTITDSIEKEKTYKKNSKKIIAHALICKIAEIILATLALISGATIPLTLSMIIVIDLIVNLPLELTLRMTSPEKKQTTKSFFIINAFTTSTILSLIFFFTFMRYGWSNNISAKAVTTVFFGFAVVQILHALQLKNSKKSFFRTCPFSNIYLFLAIIISTLLIYALSVIPPISKILGIVPISKFDWQIAFFGIFIIFILEEIRKIFARKNTKN